MRKAAATMPSPFPGMDPYLEAEGLFHGFHNRLIVAMADALVPQVRGRYIADTDLTVYIHERSADQRRPIGRPDVYVAERPGRPNAVTATVAASVASPSASVIPEAVDVEEVHSIVVRDRDSREVVTAIEVLSPTNKTKPDHRGAYLAKRRGLLYAGVNLVEVDLLRAGEPMPLRDTFDAPYRVVVSRAADRPRADVWPLGLRDRLPTVPVPLRPPDGDAMLDLQALLDRVYDAAGYADYVYDRAPEPPLREADAAWARTVIASAAR